MYNWIKHKNWYRDIRVKLKAKYNQDYFLMAGLIASISPQRDIKRNIRIAKEIYNYFKINPLNFINNWQDNKELMLTLFDIMLCHYYNILRVLKHDFNKPLELSGNKVNAFYQNLIGNDEAVTIDTWMSRFFHHNKAWINKGDYIRYSKIIIKLANKENLKPCQIQAIIWMKIRKHYGFNPVNMADYI